MTLTTETAAAIQANPRAFLDNFIADAMASPLWQEAVRREKAGGPLRIASPRDVLCERLTTAVVLAMADVPVRTNSGPVDSLKRAQLVVTLLSAIPYVWLDGVMEAVHGIELPEHIISSRVLPHPVMWWSFESGRGFIDTRNGTRADATVDGILVVGLPDGLMTVHVGSENGRAIDGVFAHEGAFSYGASWPSEFEDVYRPATGRILAMLSFLNSPYIPKEERRMDGRLRRTLEREGLPRAQADEIVRFVDLRQAGAVERADEAIEHEGRVWHHRWIVSGHHRRQWYPSEGAHWVIWIAPYVKGPADAPLKLPVYRVKR